MRNIPGSSSRQVRNQANGCMSNLPVFAHVALRPKLRNKNKKDQIRPSPSRGQSQGAFPSFKDRRRAGPPHLIDRRRSIIIIDWESIKIFEQTMKRKGKVAMFTKNKVCQLCQKYELGYCSGNALVYLGNRDSSFKESNVSENGYKKEGFETIL